MKRLALAVLVTAALAWGCAKLTLRAFDGHACSTDADEDPQRVCSPSQDLVCITTYSVRVTNPKEAPRYPGGIRQVYVCRLSCDPKQGCLEPGDVCCPGVIHGKNYGQMHACVPSALCETDAGTPDARPPADSAPRDGGDAQPRDGMVAPPDAGTDAPADAVPDTTAAPEAAAAEAAPAG